MEELILVAIVVVMLLCSVGFRYCQDKELGYFWDNPKKASFWENLGYWFYGGIFILPLLIVLGGILVGG